jgi:hypothetical protein
MLSLTKDMILGKVNLYASRGKHVKIARLITLIVTGL